MLKMHMHIHTHISLHLVFAPHAYKPGQAPEKRHTYALCTPLVPFLCMLQVHRLYRGGGGSLERAQEEWSSGVWKSAPVREAGFNAVAQSAQGPSLPQYPTSVPSYPDNSHW